MTTPDWVSAYDGEDAELRDLMERASAIAALVQHEGWQHYRDFLLTRTAATQRRLVLGNFASLEEYKDKAGWLRGITEAIGENEDGELLVLVAIRESLEAKREALGTEPNVDILASDYDDDFPQTEETP